MKIKADKFLDFQKMIQDFYRVSKRDFIWRQDITPYKILVSEIMLQQTQTARVEPKFILWLQKFPDIFSLACASRLEVLSAWQGLGYNRRGLWLHEAAKRMVLEFEGQVPDDPEILKTFTGIGPNTAASICAFAFNQPVVFIETNIRTVFLHHFFSDSREKIHDKQILPLVRSCLDYDNSRHWYYGLMDYGVYLKTKVKASNKLSSHHALQTKFVGSKRQVRGAIIRILSKGLSLSCDELCQLVAYELPENLYDVSNVVQDLMEECLIEEDNGLIKV
ncbi:MAG: A/G-specific adenine glycosylase [Candidatus Dependentiae bacterium]|nr:A/G-specific adenine glycosylase [Candidatus Dependentiae bacterium]